MSPNVSPLPIFTFVCRVLGVQPLGKSKFAQTLLSMYSWCLISTLISASFYYEIQFTQLWYSSNPVSSTLAVVFDLQVYSTLVVHALRFSRNRAEFRYLINKINGTDWAILVLILIGWFILFGNFMGFTHYVVRQSYQMSYVYHTAAFSMVVYTCYVANVRFCGIIRSLNKTLRSLEGKFITSGSTRRTLQLLDKTKNRILSVIHQASRLHMELLLSTAIDVFIRSVHYLYIYLFFVINHGLSSQLDYFIGFLCIVIFRVLLLIILISTCSTASNTVSHLAVIVCITFGLSNFLLMNFMNPEGRNHSSVNYT